MSGKGTFNPEPFAEGRFRLAYKGSFTEHPSKRGQQLVVKKKKAEYTWESNGWDVSVNLQKKSQELAGKFNLANSSAMSIKFTDVEIYQVVSSGSRLTTQVAPQLNEYVLVEDFIPGNFTKWCNNYGYISSASELMPAFMHWSWVHTKGQTMIADLQGVRNGYTYQLTDPVLLSNTTDGKVYGCTDTGVEGMAMFFLNHTCNQFCQRLSKPSPRDVVATPSALAQLDLIMTSTAYAHELKFPKYIWQNMTSIFPQVATRY